MARSAPPAKKINPLLIWLVANLYRLYSMTWRKKIIYAPEFKEYIENAKERKTPILIVGWHEDAICNLHVTRVRDVLTMNSDSKDGQFMYQVISYFGSTGARGSANKNSVKALKGFIRIMRTGQYWAAIAADGPQGPRYKAKPGVTEMSKIFTCPIFCASTSVSSAWTIKKTWDKTKIPKPFSKVVYYFGPGIPALKKTDDAKDPGLLSSLEDAMSSNSIKATELLKN